jgi:D-sedoheptulose 7-phosphate isomerase
MKFNTEISDYFSDIIKISQTIDKNNIYKLAQAINKLRKNKGRIFFLGVGGSAGNCSHAVNDFRKLCNIECYSPADNVSELTARINDDGWESSFANWLKVSKLNHKDAIFVLSVGGGNIEKKISMNLVEAINYSKKKRSKIFGIVGRDGGYTKKKGTEVVLIPTVKKNKVTPHAEAFHAVVWHCLVSHPLLQSNKTKW